MSTALDCGGVLPGGALTLDVRGKVLPLAGAEGGG